jgi:hypothetical protein
MLSDMLDLFMKRKALLWLVIYWGILWKIPNAKAQYKNLNFSIKGGMDYVLSRSVVDKNGALLAPADHPLRINYGGAIGGDVGIKLSHDHWWLMLTLNGKFYEFNPSASRPETVDRIFDTAARNTLGTLFGLQPMVGVRYYLLTDYNRPYISVDVAYMHIFTFKSTGRSNCTNAAICSSFTGSNISIFLPQSNLLSFHLRPGVEFIFHHDIAFRLEADMTRWLVFGIPGNWVFGGTAGFVFYG